MPNIVYIADDGYVLPTKVSILSIVRNVRDVRLAIHIVALALSDENRQILQALETENVTILIHDVPQPSDGLRLNHSYISDAALLKSRLHSILPDLDCALYVDGDTILHPGFLDIFDVDVADAYAAVVMDMVRMRSDNWYKEFGLERYFNSGVMYLNFTKMREDGIAERFISYFNRDDIPKTCAEQDALNATFGGKVVFMGLQYNCLTIYRSRYSIEEVLAFFKAKADDYESPAILHFASSPKPWVMPIAQDTDIWLEYVPPEDYLPILQKYSVASKTLKVESLKREIESLKRKVESLKEGLERQYASNVAKQERIDNLKGGIERRDTEIAFLKKRIEETDLKIIKTRERNDILKGGIERRNLAFDSLKKQIAKLSMVIAARDGSISSQMKAIEALQGELDGCQKALDRKNAEFQALVESRTFKVGQIVLAVPKLLLRRFKRG